MESKKDQKSDESYRDYALGKRKRPPGEDTSKFGGLLKRVLVSCWELGLNYNAVAKLRPYGLNPLAGYTNTTQSRFTQGKR